MDKYLKKMDEMCNNATKYAKESLKEKKIENMRNKKYYFRKRKKIKFIRK